MKRRCVLAIGGLDPGGGAGILADARAIARAGAYACAATTLLTVQSTRGVRTVTPLPAREVIAECKEVLAVQDVGAIKVGALGSEENVRRVGALLASHPHLPSVVDTVMLPTRGRARLLAERGAELLRARLLPHATLVTMNAAEAAALTGQRVTNAADAERAARALDLRAVLVKGGHLDDDDAVDVLVAAGRTHRLRAKRLPLRAPVHGAGCTLASLIATRLAQGDPLLTAVRASKRMHHRALADAADVGGPMRVLFA
ncbi:MAG: bifunctional hydroxymethylpyrimidine kinase/phosphomethylpyrimidine kinase [Labilithrix sp.]|nr:bifunctional hydroxymethylpyrimidine kinase/phosphomethylpyrimidine kinase [Labilithrix sp.]MCW5810032.1 bifunctional hydroxymethylpyrimidine kinase/phosphomethylpyrimidine kinase [Labilithrix sp.]